MSKKQNKKFITPEILRGAVKGAFVKLNPRYMMRNPVMFVVEIGCFITLLLSFFPGLFGDVDAGSLRIYDIIVCVILFITVLFANFAEAVAEGRGKAQAASLKKTQKDTEAHLLHEDGSETIVRSSELKKGDIVLVVAGEDLLGEPGRRQRLRAPEQLDRKAKQRMNRAQRPADAARQQQRADRKHNRQRQPAQPFAPWRFRQARAQSPFQRADGFTHDDHGMRQPRRVAKKPVQRKAAQHRIQNVHVRSSA